MPPDQTAPRPAPPDAGSLRTLAEAFVTLADSLVSDYDVVELLGTLATTCVQVLSVDAAGVALRGGDGGLHAVAASSEAGHLLELFEVQHGEGPCFDAFKDGALVVTEDLTAEAERWPQFVPKAIQLGYRAVTGLPLRLREETLGALNLFSARSGPLTPLDTRLAQALADMATIGVVQHRQDTLVRQLQHALDSRVVIEQAKGVLARTHGVDVDEAFGGLRQYARSRSLKLTQVAADVVAGRIPAETVPTLVAD